jgi:hypothetical protein
MKQNTLIIAILTGLLPAALGQWVVEDPAVLAQTILNTYLAQDQLDIYKSMNSRLGDASTLKQVAGAANVLQGLQSSAASLDSATTCAGTGAMLYSGNNLYHVIGERNPASYRKFDAAHQSAARFLTVVQDTEPRRKAVLDGIKATTEAVQKAQNHAEVLKLQAVASAQIAALNAIDGERSIALGAVLAQSLDNNTDQAKQELALKEEKAADFSAATTQFARFLTPVRPTVTIPQSRRR